MLPSSPTKLWLLCSLLACAVAAGAEETDATFERLQALGYLDAYESDRSEDGVLVRTDAAAPGLNLYTSGHAPCAFVMDLDGTVLREWCHDRDETPRVGGKPEPVPPRSWWRRAVLAPDGGAIGIYSYDRVVRLDADSHVVWEKRNGAHHDLEIRGDEVWVLAASQDGDDVHDRIDVLDLESGELRRSLPLFEPALRALPDLERTRADGDHLHTNTLNFLDAPFQGGRILLAFCNQNAVAVLDPESGELTWTLTGPFRQGLHEPVLTPEGRLVVFDNNTTKQASRVVEIDPASGDVTWEYRGSEERPFHSSALGTVQQLPNGNVLVAESIKGRAFEVTRDGEIVWEWRSPHWRRSRIRIRGQGIDDSQSDGGWKISTLTFMERIAAEDLVAEPAPAPPEG